MMLNWLRPHFQYLQYVLKHKWYVFQECVKYGLWWQGITHDWSKFLPSEWIPYAQYFYGTHRYEKVSEIRAVEWEFGANASQTKEYWKARFDEAWNHHQKRQPHHWQYWLLTFDTGDTIRLPMPDKYRKEMIADWRGASRAITGSDNTVEWYLKNRNKMRLNSDTQLWVERELGVPLDEELVEAYDPY
jgi:hypothetical protein